MKERIFRLSSCFPLLSKTTHFVAKNPSWCQFFFTPYRGKLNIEHLPPSSIAPYGIKFYSNGAILDIPCRFLKALRTRLIQSITFLHMVSRNAFRPPTGEALGKNQSKPLQPRENACSEKVFLYSIWNKEMFLRLCAISKLDAKQYIILLHTTHALPKMF